MRSIIFSSFKAVSAVVSPGDWIVNDQAKTCVFLGTVEIRSVQQIKFVISV